MSSDPGMLPMFRYPSLPLLALAFSLTAEALESFPEVGRHATPQEVAAWDIDVRPDFEGIPDGEGTVETGRLLYLEQCASCHGRAGDSTDLTTPLTGSSMSTMMRLPTLSTLFDYIQRAMPWDAPKSLEPDEVYALTAYLLHLADLVTDDFALGRHNLTEAQNLLPNRSGMNTDHDLWPGAPITRNGNP